MMLLRPCLLTITLLTECVVSQNPGKISALNLSAYFVDKNLLSKIVQDVLLLFLLLYTSNIFYLIYIITKNIIRFWPTHIYNNGHLIYKFINLFACDRLIVLTGRSITSIVYHLSELCL